MNANDLYELDILFCENFRNDDDINNDKKTIIYLCDKYNINFETYLNYYHKKLFSFHFNILSSFISYLGISLSYNFLNIIQKSIKNYKIEFFDNFNYSLNFSNDKKFYLKNSFEDINIIIEKMTFIINNYLNYDDKIKLINIKLFNDILTDCNIIIFNKHEMRSIKINNLNINLH